MMIVEGQAINYSGDDGIYKTTLRDATTVKLTDIRAINIIDDKIFYYVKATESKLMLYNMDMEGKEKNLV